jgi:hypothetical protein
MARYRIEYEIHDSDTPLGKEPAGEEQRRAYRQADLAREQQARSLGREAPEHDLGLG